jgi:hypothetical protein
MPPWPGAPKLRPISTVAQFEAVAKQCDSCLVAKISRILNRDYEWVAHPPAI